METPSPCLLLTPRQAAQALGISVSRIYKLAELRRIPFVPIGRSLRFRPASLERWLANREIGTVRQTLSTLASSKNKTKSNQEKP
jgi:excisionase family DNA binding protein